jgi:hypothetical protein
MPGLLRGVARAAVVSGTATAVSNRVSRRQANRWASEEQASPAYMAAASPAPQAPPAPSAPPAAPAADPVAQLERLGALRDSGVLTEAEFQAQKAKILG